MAKKKAPKKTPEESERGKRRRRQIKANLKGSGGFDNKKGMSHR